jgi:hypothetical protein
MDAPLLVTEKTFLPGLKPDCWNRSAPGLNFRLLEKTIPQRLKPQSKYKPMS